MVGVATRAHARLRDDSAHPGGCGVSVNRCHPAHSAEFRRRLLSRDVFQDLLMMADQDAGRLRLQLCQRRTQNADPGTGESFLHRTGREHRTARTEWGRRQDASGLGTRLSSRHGAYQDTLHHRGRLDAAAVGRTPQRSTKTVLQSGDPGSAVGKGVKFTSAFQEQRGSVFNRR